jgi:CHAT domain-containing protein/tetratricopeptide (TPR) repeat protein
MKKMQFLLILVMVVITCWVWAQLPGTTINKEKLSKANRLYDLDEPTTRTDSTALALFLETAAQAIETGSEFEIAVNNFIKAGNIHQTYHRYPQANQLYYQSLYINKTYLRSAPLEYEASLFLGTSRYYQNIIDSAQIYFERAFDIVVRNPLTKLPEQEHLYNSLGAIYFEGANYQQAKNYFERALQAADKTNTEFNETYVSIKNNIAQCLIQLKQYAEALKVYKELLSLRTEQKNLLLQNIAHTYFELEQYDSALKIYSNLPAQNPLNHIVALNDIGRIYMKRGQWAMAERIFDSAIYANKKMAATIKNKEEAQAYLYRSELAMIQGLTDEALTWCDLALQEVHMNYKGAGIEALPDKVSEAVSPIVLFQALRQKALLAHNKFDKEGRQQYLKAGLEAYKKAVQTANYIKRNFDNDEAKLFFNDKNTAIYKDAIAMAAKAVAQDDQFIDDFLFFSDSYKGSIVFQNLESIELKSNAQIPDSIKKREKEIKQLMAVYTSRINNNNSASSVLPLQERLLELQVELSRLQKQYEKDATYNLYKYQQEASALSLAGLQQFLDNETAFIDFITYDSVLYVMAINKNEWALQPVPIGSSFNREFQKFIQENYLQLQGKRYEGFAAGAFLYKKLLHPVNNIIGGRKRWVIIPDGLLHYLPFDALVTDEEDRDYLLKNHAMSYHYSFQLLTQTDKKFYSQLQTNISIAFAPFTVSDNLVKQSKFQVLPYSLYEVKSFTSNYFTSYKATKNFFLSTAPNHQVIHLATHASVGSDSVNNWIQFYPADTAEINNRLYIHEVYNMNLHKTNLVILSACETAGGTSIAGEGLLSLSRAFIYAGSDGIISTLWKTEDKVTAFLMERLHININKGMLPELALQTAKIELLDNSLIGAQYKTPNYWSNFIYAGKIKPASIADKGLKGWFFLSIAVLLLYLVYVLTKKRFLPLQ